MNYDCFTNGHDWRYDAGHDLTNQVPAARRSYGPFRVCRRCLTGHQLADIPAGHPESLTAELPEKDEEWLAEIEADLFPDHENA